MQPGTINSLLTSPFVLAILFVTFWCAVCFLVSFISGWFTLARHFKKQTEPYGDSKTAGPFSYTVYMRFWSHYSSLIRITAAGDALYLSILLPFRMGHPPLCIPWSEIKFSRTKFLFVTYVVLTLGSKEQIPLRITQRMARNLGVIDRALV